MKLSVRGKSKNLSLAETRFAIKFYIDKLFANDQDIIPELELQISYVTMKDKGCCNVDDDVDIDPREFELEICYNLSKRQTLRTLAHECVHVYQFATNQLQDCTANRIVWNKVSIDMDSVDYWDLPSEIDAFGREEGLYVRYCEHVAEHGLKFLKPKAKKELDETSDT